MKRALITIATVGILAPTAWVAGANAQYGPSPPPGPSAASNPSQGYSAPQNTRRVSRRAARQTPSAATANTPPSQAYAQASQGHFTWYASPGPMNRGNECITNVDSTRGYGFRGPCKK